jgi:drug/metabolite transporter (DMT)-like permease
MTLSAIILCVICQLLIVAGQIQLKHGVGGQRLRPGPFTAGVLCLAIWFFLWLGLMGKLDLSKLYPFEGLNPAMMAVGAWLFLKEKLSTGTWAGLVLVCIGVAVVAGS